MGHGGSAKENRIAIYVRNGARVFNDRINQAEGIASSMFAPAGVKIDSPASNRSGAPAYAQPYGEIHIVIFWDRIQDGIAPQSCWRTFADEDMKLIQVGLNARANVSRPAPVTVEAE